MALARLALKGEVLRDGGRECGLEFAVRRVLALGDGVVEL